MIRKLTVLGFCVFGFMAQAQIRVGLESNSQWYIDDNKIKLPEHEAEERFRSNSYINLGYDYKKWSFGVQLESYAPKPILNYSPDFDKFDFGTVFARYNDVDAGIDITGGHFYEQYGSGLIFRAWEDRQIGINNAIFGVNAKFEPIEGLKIGMLGGKQRIGMGFDLSKSFVFGSNIEFALSEYVNLGGGEIGIGASYFGKKEEMVDYKQDYNQGLEKIRGAFSARLDAEFGNFNADLEYVYKQSDALVDLGNVLGYARQPGKAAVLNLGYFERGVGFTVNLRRLENMSFYSDRVFNGNEFNQAILNYVPSLTKQYDYSLQNIYVYQAQHRLDLYGAEPKLGEIGGQFDFFYEFKKGSSLGGKYGTNVVVNGSYWAGLKAEPINDGDGLKAEFFDFGDKYYHDFGIEIRKRWSKNWSSIFMYLNQGYEGAVVDYTSDVKTNIASVETTYQFLDNKSVRLEAQHMWADADKKNWVAGTLEVAVNSNWSVFGSDMYNYGNDDDDAKIHYYNAGVSFTKGSTRVAASYGRQRGGLLCVGGVCRMVAEASGLTIGISTSF